MSVGKRTSGQFFVAAALLGLAGVIGLRSTPAAGVMQLALGVSMAAAGVVLLADAGSARGLGLLASGLTTLVGVAALIGTRSYFVGTIVAGSAFLQLARPRDAAVRPAPTFGFGAPPALPSPRGGAAVGQPAPGPYPPAAAAQVSTASVAARPCAVPVGASTDGGSTDAASLGPPGTPAATLSQWQAWLDPARSGADARLSAGEAAALGSAAQDDDLRWRLMLAAVDPRVDVSQVLASDLSAMEIAAIAPPARERLERAALLLTQAGEAAQGGAGYPSVLVVHAWLMWYMGEVTRAASILTHALEAQPSHIGALRLQTVIAAGAPAPWTRTSGRPMAPTGR